MPERKAKKPRLQDLDSVAVNLETDYFVRTFYGLNSMRWPHELCEQLRKCGVVNFVKSDVEESSPDLREWLQSHYLSLDVDSKVFVGGEKNGLERLQLRNKKMAHFNNAFCQKSTDKRVKDCWSYMECHVRQCLDAIMHEQLELIDGVSREFIIKTCDNSESSVLSVFVYDAQPTGVVICPDHVDRGFITCTTNQDGGLEVFVDGRWLKIPPTKGLVCFTGYALNKMSCGKIPMVRHRVVSMGPQKKRISIAFKLRPDVTRSTFCEPLWNMMQDFEAQYPSVNKPSYQGREKPSGLADWTEVGTSSLGPSAYLEICVNKGLPWQKKPPGLLWADFCKSWNNKVSVWGAKHFQILSGTRGLFRRQSREPKQRKWSDLLTDAELVFPHNIYVIMCDQLTVQESTRNDFFRRNFVSLGSTIRMFKDFVPRWGEVFEFYNIQNGAINLEPIFIVHERVIRGD